MYPPSFKSTVPGGLLTTIQQIVGGIIVSIGLYAHASDITSPGNRLDPNFHSIAPYFNSIKSKSTQAAIVGDDYPDHISALKAVIIGNAATISRTDDSAETLDHDWIPVQLAAGKSYAVHNLFNKQFTVGDGHGLYFYTTQSFMALRNSQGHALPHLVSHGRDFAFSAPATGRYYLDVSGIASSVNVQSYQDDYVDNSASRGRLVLLAQRYAAINGNSEVNGDHDWFKAPLKAGKNYLFAVKSGQNGLAYPELQLYSPAGKAILALSQGAQVSFTATASGTYYVDVASWLDDQSFDVDYAKNSGKYQGTYTLTLTQKNDDYGNHQFTAGTFSLPAADSVNVALNGHIETKGDHDWLAIKLLAHKTYDFSMADTNAKLFGMALYDAKGALLKYRTTGSYLTYTSGRVGRYYLDIKALSKKVTGYYHLNVVSYLDAYPDYIAGVKPLRPGAKPLSENLSFKQDHDWFPFQASLGTRYKIQVSAGYDAYHFFPLVALRNVNGQIVTREAWQAFGRDDRFFEFTSSKSGLFYIDVGGSECGCAVYGSSHGTNTRYGISLQASKITLKPL